MIDMKQKDLNIDIEAVERISKQDPNNKRAQVWKYIFYISFVLIVTGVSLYFALAPDFDGVISAFATADIGMIFAIVGIVLVTYLLDGFVVFIFMRLYTKKYKIYQGAAVSAIGTFYSGITPSATGGQIMQVYTLKKQGADVSNAASIMVMWFILYQTALIIFDIIAVIFKSNLMVDAGTFYFDLGFINLELSLAPLTILGFLVNASIIGLLYLMSYSSKFHSFIMRFAVGLLGKIKLVKNVDKTRERLRIQVENFKIEMRRLQSNVPVTVLIILLFLIILLLRFSIPWFAGIAFDGYGLNEITGEMSGGNLSVASFFDAAFISAYHQMVSGLIPTPGLAGVSELFFAQLFGDFYRTEAIRNASQIIWRSATYYLVILVTGMVSAFYKASPKEEALLSTRATFIDIQLKTYEIRKSSSDTLYETKRLGLKEIQKRVKEKEAAEALLLNNIDDQPSVENNIIEAKKMVDLNEDNEIKKMKKVKDKKPKKEKKAKSKDTDPDDWTNISI